MTRLQISLAVVGQLQDSISYKTYSLLRHFKCLKVVFYCVFKYSDYSVIPIRCNIHSGLDSGNYMTNHFMQQSHIVITRPSEQFIICSLLNRFGKGFQVNFWKLLLHKIHRRKGEQLFFPFQCQIGRKLHDFKDFFQDEATCKWLVMYRKT